MAMKKGADIQERAFEFACEVVELYDRLEKRSGSSRVSKCGIALKEAREAHYWLRVMYRTRKLSDADGAEHLLTEANRLVAILTTIVRKTRATA